MNASIKTNVADYLTVAADQAHGNYGNLTLLLLYATLGVVVIYPSITVGTFQHCLTSTNLA